MFAWISMSEQILLAHDEVGRANLVNVSSGAGRAVAAVVACYGWGVKDLSDWAWWHFGFYLVICFGCTLAIAAYGRPRMVILWRDLGRGLTIAAAGLFTFLRRNADVLVLGAVASPAVVGVYSVARRIVGTADVVSASLDRLVYSNLAVAGADGPEATLRLAARYAGIATLLCGLTSIALYVAAPWVPLIFGAQYADAVGMIRFLAWLLILTSLHNLASDALNAAEQHEKRLAAETAAGLAATALMVGLTVLYTLNGMLISIYISGMLSVGALWSTLFWLARRSRCA
jgi:O-antigen/teichoic acid export membrane protein